MPYDKSLDMEVFKETKEFEDTRVTVGVFSYNGGEKKLQISRENRTAEEWRFAKLGRMTRQEAQEVLPVLTKALQSM
ncbi:MAG TPA: hypothetical protein PKO44_06300 [Candidatus Omnitrophota bacterium]|nr:hypothetical protein [Candidatus Omnitrophota bacterium]